MNYLTEGKMLNLHHVAKSGEASPSESKDYVAIFVSARTRNPELKEMKPVRIPIDTQTWNGFIRSLCSLTEEFSKKAILCHAAPSANFRFNQSALLVIGKEMQRQGWLEEKEKVHPT